MAYDCQCQACPHHSADHHAGDYPPPDGLGPNYCLYEGCGCTDLTLPPWHPYASAAERDAAVERGE